MVRRGISDAITIIKEKDEVKTDKANIIQM